MKDKDYEQRATKIIMNTVEGVKAQIRKAYNKGYKDGQAEYEDKQEPKCANCRHFHRLKHNFECGKGFVESHCCTIMLENDFEPSDITWAQEVEEDSRCEMFTEKGADK